MAEVIQRKPQMKVLRALPIIKPNAALIVLPTVIAGASISRAATVSALAMLALIMFWMRRSPEDHVEWAWPALIFPVIGATIVLRPNHPSTLVSVIFFALASVALLRACYLSASRSSGLVSLIDGVALFLVASVALWLLGFVGTSSRVLGLSNSFTGGQRVVFPLVDALPATPAMAAVFLAGAVPARLVSNRFGGARWIATFCALLILILSGSRVAAAAALLVPVAAFFVPKLFRVIAPWAVAFFLFLPFAFVYGDNFAKGVVTLFSSAFPFLTSGVRADTVGGRQNIWSKAIEFYQQKVDSTHQAIGYGSFGQAKSGASSSWNEAMTGFGSSDVALVTPHSSILQLLFDGGWVATGIFAIATISLSFLLSRRSSTFDITALSILVALAVCGSTEVALSPGNAQPTWWILVALAAIVFARDSFAVHDQLVVDAVTAKKIHASGQSSLNASPSAVKKGFERRLPHTATPAHVPSRLQT
jgi:hypothetical protein